MASAESLIEELYRDRYVGFRNALAPIVGSADAARDVVQEAFARALRDAAKLRRGSRPPRGCGASPFASP